MVLPEGVKEITLGYAQIEEAGCPFFTRTSKIVKKKSLQKTKMPSMQFVQLSRKLWQGATFRPTSVCSYKSIYPHSNNIKFIRPL